VHGPVEARVTVGDAIEVSTAREARGEHDPLMSAIEEQLRAMLGIAPAESNSRISMPTARPPDLAMPAATQVPPETT
jgi:hypothetical protein